MNFKFIDMIKRDKEIVNDILGFLISSSNGIDNNPLTLLSTCFLFENPKTFYAEEYSAFDLFEAQNSFRAYHFMLDEIKANKELDIKLILEFDKLINIDYPKGFREVETFIRRTNAKTWHPDLIKDEVEKLINHYNQVFKEKIDFEELAKFQIEFETIFPFLYNDGKIARLLINWYLFKLELAPTYIDVTQKEEYFRCLAEKDYKALANILEENQKYLDFRLDCQRNKYDYFRPEFINQLFKGCEIIEE